MRHSLPGIAFAIGVVGLAQPLAAKVVKFEILRTESPAFEGRRFGTVGTYDRIIADIDRASRNSQGLVEAVSEVEILRPTIASNGNRRLFYEVLNRGNKLGLALFNDNNIVNDL